MKTFFGLAFLANAVFFAIILTVAVVYSAPMLFGVLLYNLGTALILKKAYDGNL